MKIFFRNLLHRALAFSLWGYCVAHRFKVRWVRNEEQQQQHDRLVQKIFHEAGYFESPDTPLTEEHPDSTCQCFLVYHAGKPVGTSMIVQNPQQLPVEEFFNIRIPEDIDRSELGELTRFVINQDYRDPPPVASYGLFNAALTYSRKKKIRWWIWCGPSYFFWGFQSFFTRCIVLEQLPLEPEQIELRKGREAYFDESRSIRVALVDTYSINLWRSNNVFWKRIWQRIKILATGKRKKTRRKVSS